MVPWEHVICGGQFWVNVGYTLDDTMRGESDIWGYNFGGGDPNLEGT